MTSLRKFAEAESDALCVVLRLFSHDAALSMSNWSDLWQDMARREAEWVAFQKAHGWDAACSATLNASMACKKQELLQTASTYSILKKNKAKTERMMAKCTAKMEALQREVQQKQAEKKQYFSALLRTQNKLLFQASRHTCRFLTFVLKLFVIMGARRITCLRRRRRSRRCTRRLRRCSRS